MGSESVEESPVMLADVLAPCGLYCAVCLDAIVNKVCHGCGCGCGRCAGGWHYEHCSISTCTASKGFKTCAECSDFPCMELIQFAYHPFAVHHLSVIEVLRRVQRVGMEKVLEELRSYFLEKETRLEWAFTEEYVGRRAQAFQAWRAQLDEEARE